MATITNLQDWVEVEMMRKPLEWIFEWFWEKIGNQAVNARKTRS